MEVEILFEDTEAFVDELDLITQHKVVHTLELLKVFGHKIGLPHSKHIEGSLFELRIRGKTPVRFIYCFYRGNACILHGFIKRRSKIPQSNLNIARTRLKLLCKT